MLSLLGNLGGFMSFFKTEQDKKILQRIREARKQGITSMKVVGRGTLVMDPVELAKTDKVRNARIAAKDLVTG